MVTSFLPLADMLSKGGWIEMHEVDADANIPKPGAQLVYMISL